MIFLYRQRPRFFLLGLLFSVGLVASALGSLESDWNNPPPEARLKAYWWWLNGNVTKEAITHDLEGMKAKGFGGAVIFDADGASQDGNGKVPSGPTFASPAWRELFKHTVREADRLGLELSLNIQSGWNLGGPTVKAEDAPKKLVWTEMRLKGGAKVVRKIESPKGKDNFYRDLVMLAYRANPPVSPTRKPLQRQAEKALLKAFKPSSAPDTSSLFEDVPGIAGEEDAHAKEIIDLTSKLSREDELNWDAPAGDWVVLRFGFTLNDRCRVSTSSGDWKGYALDPYDSGAFERYWDAVVEPLIADVAPFAGKALKYLHTDSWEIGVANWTPTLAVEFQQRRGYELLPWLPVIAGKIVNSREESNRFLHDFRRTMGDLAIDNHYRIFRDRAHQHGLLIHPESGGPHAVPIDAQQCLGFNDAPMSEFWAWSPKHRVGDDNRYFVKQPASAAHTYGRKLVVAEGFTTVGPHWEETLWDNLKPSFDKALTEGLNLLVWHAFVCSPKEQGIPGQQYFAGTHLNPNVTWWDKSGPLFDYINRCQALLQQGRPYADALYYYGDQVPNFTQHRRIDPARVGRGYDYDVITEEALLTRASVRDGRIVLPDGVSYRVLVLVDREVISLPVLRKVKELVAAGATVVGPRPRQASGLKDATQTDAEVKRLADELWGAGKIASNQTGRAALMTLGVLPDFEWKPEARADAAADLEYIHRSVAGTEIYFVANFSNVAARVDCTFRVADKAPELWNPVTGERRFASAYEIKAGRATLPLNFAPCGSWFVVFREPASQHPARSASNIPELKTLAEIAGDWTVKFDPHWGGPASAAFSQLVSWTERPEAGIKFYSGTAVYAKSFELPSEARAERVWLDLGRVRELAEVRVNGKSCGIVWAPPFQVDITDALKPGGNQLEVEVVNFWPNRIIGDAALPKEQRLTQTNIRKLAKDTKLMESGLLGPVKLIRSAAPEATHSVREP